MKAWAKSLAVGFLVWLAVMWSASGCIEPPVGDPASQYWEPREGCIVHTETPYWLVGVVGALVATAWMLHHYGVWRYEHPKSN